MPVRDGFASAARSRRSPGPPRLGHLACLADCGYVRARRAGRFAYYTVADPRVADLVVLARSLAADNVSALADCVRIAQPRRGVSDSATALRHGQTQYDVARHRDPSDLW